MSLWDRWDIKKGPGITLQQLIDAIKENYQLKVRDIFLKSKPIYSAIMLEKKPEQEQKETLAEKLVDTLEV